MSSNKEKGFTLVELVVVIVVLGILALVTIPAYQDIASDAKDGSAKGQLGTIRAAIALSYAKNAISSSNAFYPSTISAAMFADNTVPKEPFLNSNAVVTANPISVDNAGGWMYNPTNGEVRVNVTGKETF